MASQRTPLQDAGSLLSDLTVAQVSQYQALQAALIAIMNTQLEEHVSIRELSTGDPLTWDDLPEIRVMFRLQIGDEWLSFECGSVWSRVSGEEYSLENLIIPAQHGDIRALQLVLGSVVGVSDSICVPVEFDVRDQQVWVNLSYYELLPLET